MAMMGTFSADFMSEMLSRLIPQRRSPSEMVPVYFPSRLSMGMQENFRCSIFSMVCLKVSFSKMYAISLFGVKKNRIFTPDTSFLFLSGLPVFQGEESGQKSVYYRGVKMGNWRRILIIVSLRRCVNERILKFFENNEGRKDFPGESPIKGELPRVRPPVQPPPARGKSEPLRYGPFGGKTCRSGTGRCLRRW